MQSNDESAAWRFKWMHPRFRNQGIAEVRATDPGLEEARLVVARENGFDAWPELLQFAEQVRIEGPIACFERTIEAIVAGDATTLGTMLRDNPEIARARSVRRHRATLLHYVAANGVEDVRQKTPANAVAIAELLLAAGADVDALADLYGTGCTTLSLLVSSCHPAEAGLQIALADVLLDHGASTNWPGTRRNSAIITALAFGYADTAAAIFRRVGAVDDIAAAAGLGRLAEVEQQLPAADAPSRHVALALAAQHGQTEVVRLLLDAGENPNRYNPEGFHAHSTPLHQAVWANHPEVVRLLVEHGARLELRDRIYLGTPLGWALHGGRWEIAEFLRTRGAAER
jgi:ankyrin repeat protein